MIKFFKNLTLLITTVLVFAFTINKNREFIPPGTQQINDTLFADETEVSNFSWQEYEYWTANTFGENSPEHLATLTDTSVWRQKLSYNEPYVIHYYRHPAYKNFPVIGISYEQAIAYCIWRTERVKEYMNLNKNFKNQNFKYRLPSKIEWELIASSTSYILNNNGKNKKGIYQLNCIHVIDSLGIKKVDFIEHSDVTAPVNSYWPNRFKLYNVLGNVSEMVMEKGISKGGSWRHQLEECRVGKNQEYTKPNSWTGFRCVCVKTKIH